MFTSRYPNYNFTSGDSSAILQKDGQPDPFEINIGNNRVTNMNLQVLVSGTNGATNATLKVLLSNNGSNFTEVNKEISIVPDKTSYYIFFDASMAQARNIQLSLDVVAGAGIITKVILGYA